MDVLERFSPATRAWFTGTFPAPTDAQLGAWDAISRGSHTLVVAPTGSGKTLSAFLWALDRLAAEPYSPPADDEPPRSRCRVLYVSPLKALATDVERNLRSPLVGIGQAAKRLGVDPPQVRVALRSGDTPADQRRSFARDPADILITTPESLFLLLTSQARQALSGVQTVILDEVHAVAGTKRGAHLAVSLERLDALLARPAQRIGLSATVRPVDEVARFLAGGRPVEIVAPPSHKRWDLEVVVPVADLAELGTSAPDASDPQQRSSIWPHVEERIVDLIASHTSTLVFANSRRLAERLTARLNEIWGERLEAEADGGPGTDGGRGEGSGRGADGGQGEGSGRGADGHVAPPGYPRFPAQAVGQSGVGWGATPVLARAHHGSVSREQRAQTEDDLKAGRLPAVVATSSLELGIDMGAVDLVVQVEAPPSVASGLQRIGRAGHQVGAVSHGVLFPKFRGDLVQTAVITERMRAGQIESMHVPANPLDILAQQIVAMVAVDDWTVDALADLMRRAAPFAGLSRPVLEAVLDMLSGRYPSDEFAELRPRIVWDRVSGVVSGRRGAQHLAVLSGGTIPDRGLFGVFLAGGDGPGRRVGELDEEMVYESRVGDVITLGSSSWRIEDITHDRVLVTPAPGVPGRLPFWKGDTIGRPAELGAAVGAFVRQVSRLPPDEARTRVRESGLDAWAADNLLAYLTEQRESTGIVPDDTTLVVERFRDELGDWRLVVHSPYGARVHGPWALGVSARMRERYGLDVQAMPADDGIVFRLPDTAEDWLAPYGQEDDTSPGERFDAADVLSSLVLDPDEVMGLVTEQLAGSALFAARFRECAARALLLPRRRPDRRQPLWQQRQRAAQLLEVASRYPSFPIVLEAVRECVQDVFDVPGLVDLLRRIAERQVSVVEVSTTTPSPFAKSLLFGYVAQFMYEGDSPLAERRAAALTLDPTLLADLLGDEGPALSELLDPDALTRTEAELQFLAPTRQARDAEDVVDIVRMIGPISESELLRRVRPDVADRVPEWLAEQVSARRLISVQLGGAPRWAVPEDAGRLRDALGIGLPLGLPDAFLDITVDPLGELVARFSRSHVAFTTAEVASWLGIGVSVAREVIARFLAEGRLASGDLRPPGWRPAAFAGPAAERDAAPPHYCDPKVLSLLRRRSLASLRAEVEPVSPVDFARFLPSWEGIGGVQAPAAAPVRGDQVGEKGRTSYGGQLRGVDGVLRAVEQLAGVRLPASAWESLVLPARVADYAPAQLDELTTTGEVLWQGSGDLAGGDGWISLYPAELADVLGVAGPAPADALDDAVLAALADQGAYFLGPLLERVRLTADTDVSQSQLVDALWRLVWSGWVTNDSIAGVRARLGAGTTAHRSRSAAPRRGRYGRPAALPRRPTGLSRASVPPHGVGRWSLFPAHADLDPAARTYTEVVRSEVLLDRYGIVTRGSVVAEDVVGGFAGVYRVLGAAEEAGRVRRGYFIEGLGAAQFGGTGAVDRLRSQSRVLDDGSPPDRIVVLAACDPANPYGAALPWPTHEHDSQGRGHQPARKAGALVVLVDGDLALYVERGGRTLLSWPEDPARLAAAAIGLAGAVHRGALGRLTVSMIDGESVMRSDHPLAQALTDAGFLLTPQGLRLRR